MLAERSNTCIFRKTITITVHATADDWQLYDLPGREEAAIALNQRFEALVNQGARRSEVRNGMCLSDYANLGAARTEVRYFVEDLLDKTFGEFESLRTLHIGR